MWGIVTLCVMGIFALIAFLGLSLGGAVAGGEAGGVVGAIFGGLAGVAGGGLLAVLLVARTIVRFALLIGGVYMLHLSYLGHDHWDTKKMVIGAIAMGIGLLVSRTSKSSSISSKSSDD